MDKFVEKEKRSKKARRAENARARTLWTVHPVTRRVPSGKLYRRCKLSKPA